MLRRLAALLLGPPARALASVGVSANTVTALSLAAGAAGGGCLALGWFAAAAVLVVVASVGDGLDGLVARETHTASAGGAIFDAAVDRYEELFVLGGLAIYFRASAALLALALFALGGSFMVSYGSAKAEALRVSVPGGLMRREHRAILVCAGIALVPVARVAARAFALPAWAGTAPAVATLGVLAVATNVSAVRRLRAVAREARGRDR